MTRPRLTAGLIARFAGSPLPGMLFRAQGAWLRLRPRVTLGVRTLVTDAQGRILLVRHTYRPGWYLPGGGVQRWETLEQAAIRETREEAGARILRMDRLVGVFANFMAERSDHVALFAAAEWEPVPAASPEIAEAGFYPTDALPEGTTAPTLRRLAELRGDRRPDGVW